MGAQKAQRSPSPESKWNSDWAGQLSNWVDCRHEALELEANRKVTLWRLGSVGSGVHTPALPLTPSATLALEPEKWVDDG